MVQIKQNLVPASKYSIKCPHTMNPEYITVHNTANDASAANEIAYMIRNDNQVSFHFAVDDIEAVQGIPLNRNAWAAGDGGNGPGNRKSIHVEICYSKSGGERYQKAEANAIKLIAQLLKGRGWGIDRLKKHQDWSGKYCPHRILAEGRWEEFKKAVERELNTVSIAKKDDITGHWAEQSIRKAMKAGIIKGHSDGRFGPDEPVTRAQLAVILDRLELLK